MDANLEIGWQTGARPKTNKSKRLRNDLTFLDASSIVEFISRSRNNNNNSGLLIESQSKRRKMNKSVNKSAELANSSLRHIGLETTREAQTGATRGVFYVEDHPPSSSTTTGGV